MVERIDAPKVYISYAWSSTKHQQWVLTLAEKLVSDGVDVIIDKWDLKEGQDKYAFMEKMVNDPNVNRVLLILDKEYSHKADNRKGGVGTETQIISQEIYEKIDQEKFIPIVREKNNEGKPYIPTFLKGRIYIDLTSDHGFYEEYEKILRNVFEKPKYEKPPLGSPPKHIIDNKVTQTKSALEVEYLRSSILNNSSSSLYSIDQYLTKLKKDLQEELVISDEYPDNEFDDLIVDSIALLKTRRDQFLSIFNLICQLSESDKFFMRFRKFFEDSIPLMFPGKNLGTYFTYQFDNIRFFLYELFLYVFALLVKHERTDEIELFIGNQYYFVDRSQKRNSNYIIFNLEMDSINKIRNKRLKLNRISLVGDMIVERADRDIVSLEQLIQADFLLCLRSIIDEGMLYSYWDPRTIIHSLKVNPPFDIFYRSHSMEYFDKLKQILDIDSKEQLVNAIEKLKSLGIFNYWRSRIPLERIVNLNEIGTT